MSDKDLLRGAFRFLRSESEDAAFLQAGGEAALGCRLAQAYDAKLHKEFALVDLSRAPAQLGLRWRTEAEVLRGKGESYCASLGCSSVEGLRAFEVPFQYQEAGQGKVALVKLLCCGACAAKAFGGAALLPAH
jgi:protein FRA10AC1